MATFPDNIGNLLAVVQEASEQHKHSNFTGGGKSRCCIPVLHPNGDFTRYWDLSVSLLLLYVSFVTPYDIAFMGEDGDLVGFFGILFILVKYAVDFVFWCDLVLQFRIAWHDEENKVMYEWKRAVVRYAESFFFIDLLSCIPYGIIANAFVNSGNSSGDSIAVLKLLRLLRLFKLAKLLRASRILRRWETQIHVKYGYRRIAAFISIIVLVSHFMACMYYLVSNSSDHPDAWVKNPEYAGYTNAQFYILSLYWSIMTITTIGYGDISPQSTEERLIAILFMAIGACLYSYIVGTMCSVVQGLNVTKNEFQNRMDAINEYMEMSYFPTHLRRRIRAYMYYQRDSVGNIEMAEQQLFESVSPALKLMCAYFKYHVLLENVPYFHRAPQQFISELALLLKHCVFMPAECIMSVGEVGLEMYFLRRGRAHLEVPGADGGPAIVQKLEDGDHFGERGMLFGAKRLATVRCLVYCDTCALTKSDYNSVAEHHPDVQAEIRRVVVRNMWKTLAQSGMLKKAFERAAKVPRITQPAIKTQLAQMDEQMKILQATLRNHNLEAKEQEQLYTDSFSAMRTDFGGKIKENAGRDGSLTRSRTTCRGCQVFEGRKATTKAFLCVRPTNEEHFRACRWWKTT